MGIFGNKAIVGVAVTPENGLEVAQIDFQTQTILKYGRRSIDFNVTRREIGDLDVFKETLQDLFAELQIPSGSEIVLSIPSIVFRVTEYPAALDMYQVSNAVEEELRSNPWFNDTNIEPSFSYAVLPQSTMQFRKVAYTAAQNNVVLELAMFIKQIKHKLIAIDTSVDSILHSLIYTGRVTADANTNWVLLIVENNSCQVLSMMGRSYLDSFEEKINIGEILGDAENYSTVLGAIEPLLRNLPSKQLVIVSKTGAINAQSLASKLSYQASIVPIDCNRYSQGALLNLGTSIDPEDARTMSFDAIGAAVYKNLAKYIPVQLNLYNESLGDIYLNEQPLKVGNFVISNALLFILWVIIAAAIFALTMSAKAYYMVETNKYQSEKEQLNQKIREIQSYLDAHPDVSTEIFDEGTEIASGIAHNKNIYSYYTIMGTEIPRKLWLTHLKLGNKTTIEGQADNLESIYSFFRNIKDYNPDSDIRLQKMGLANASSGSLPGDIDLNMPLTSMSADFYEFRISNEPLPMPKTGDKGNGNGDDDSGLLPGDLDIIE